MYSYLHTQRQWRPLCIRTVIIHAKSTACAYDYNTANTDAPVWKSYNRTSTDILQHMPVMQPAHTPLHMFTIHVPDTPHPTIHFYHTASREAPFNAALNWDSYVTCNASNRNEDQEYFLGGKGSRCVGLTTLPPSCADCLEIWEPQPPGTLRASPGCNGIAVPLPLCNLQQKTVYTRPACLHHSL
jgi:hypothetical protein